MDCLIHFLGGHTADEFAAMRRSRDANKLAAQEGKPEWRGGMTAPWCNIHQQWIGDCPESCPKLSHDSQRIGW